MCIEKDPDKWLLLTTGRAPRYDIEQPNAELCRCQCRRRSSQEQEEETKMTIWENQRGYCSLLNEKLAFLQKDKKGT